MSDLGRGGTVDEDRLPWLEPVEDESAGDGISPVRLAVGVLVMLIALGLVVGGVYWLKQRSTAPDGNAQDPTLIAAQPGPYKTKPDEPGGMDVKGQGDSSYAASEGADPNAKIDLSATPEAPVDKSKPAAAAPAPTQAAPPVQAAPTKTAPVQTAKAEPAPVKAPAPKPAAPAKVEPAKTQTAAAAPASTLSGSGQIQLGALDSPAKAEAAWKSLSGRYASLAPLSHAVVKAEVNGKTYYRLRAAAGGQASSICSKLKIAGDACSVVG